MRKLIQMNQSGKSVDLKVPPGNRLEALFRWTYASYANVAIVDDH